MADYKPLNRYHNRAKISEVKFRLLLRCFALDFTASDTARLSGLSVRSVNDLFLKLRRRILTLCPIPVQLQGTLELDESYFGPRRIPGKARPWSRLQNHHLRPTQTGWLYLHRNHPRLL